MVKINFEINSEHGSYRDAIVLPIDHNMSDAEIEAVKQQRFDAWKTHIIATSEIIEEHQE